MKIKFIPKAHKSEHPQRNETKSTYSAYATQNKLSIPMMMKINTFYPNFVLAKSHATKAH